MYFNDLSGQICKFQNNEDWLNHSGLANTYLIGSLALLNEMFLGRGEGSFFYLKDSLLIFTGILFVVICVYK